MDNHLCGLTFSIIYLYARVPSTVNERVYVWVLRAKKKPHHRVSTLDVRTSFRSNPRPKISNVFGLPTKLYLHQNARLSLKLVIVGHGFLRSPDFSWESRDDRLVRTSSKPHMWTANLSMEKLFACNGFDDIVILYKPFLSFLDCTDIAIPFNLSLLLTYLQFIVGLWRGNCRRVLCMFTTIWPTGWWHTSWSRTPTFVVVYANPWFSRWSIFFSYCFIFYVLTSFRFLTD